MRPAFRRVPTTTPLIAALLVACQPGGDQAEAQPGPTAAAGAASGALVPLPDYDGTVPPLTKSTTIRMRTTAGEITIAVYADAAPNAAKRFVELVQSGFYNATPISRVVPGFVAQFGVNWRAPHKSWKDRNFNDDPTIFALQRGTLAFAKAGPNTNSTQVFINYVENNRLADPQYNFTVFGSVVSGMDVVDKFVQVGDPSGGLDPDRLWRGRGAFPGPPPAQAPVVGRAPGAG
mgnify:CR=1 FL=1